MNTKQLKYVLVLAREGSFSRAANTLNITQPSLSQYIKKIEKELGAELFDRANGDVRLTDAGRVYLEVGRQMLDLEHQMEQRLSDIAVCKTGSLIIGTAPYRAVGMMPTVAKQYQELYPGMHLIVREGTTAELAEGMEHGEFDLCLTLLPLDSRLFCWEKVVEEELVLAVPADAPEFETQNVPDRRYAAIDAAALNGRRFVMLTETQFMQKQLEDLCYDHKLRLETAAVVKSLEAQIAMVRAGVGMALVPRGIERFCGLDELRFYSFAQALPRRELVVMWRKEHTLSKAADDLKKIILRIDW